MMKLKMSKYISVRKVNCFKKKICICKIVKGIEERFCLCVFWSGKYMYV